MLTDSQQVAPPYSQLLETYGPFRTWARWIQVILPWLIGLAFVVVEIRRVSEQIAVRYPDFFGFAQRAARFDLQHLSQWDWVHGLYPLGYPLLLRLGVELGLDVLRAAFVISILGGFLGLLGTFWLVQRMTGDWALAVFSQVILACMSFYLFYGNLDSTDMLAAGLQILSFVLLFSQTRRPRVAFGAGLIAGLSYLIRYTAALTILLCLLFLLGLALKRRQREDRMAAGAYLFGAMLGAAPQLIASTLIKGNPFYSHQAHNLWFHLTGSSDYLRVWSSVPMDISLWEVVSTDPRRFFTHWFEVFRSAWRTGDVVALDVPLGMLTHAGLLYAVLVPGALKRSARAFIAIYTVGLLALLSFTRLDRRFLITLMPFQVLGSLYFLWNVLPSRVRIQRFIVSVRTLGLILLVVQLGQYPLKFMRANPPDTEIVEVSNTLHGAGMASTHEVLSTHTDFHDVADPWKRRFDKAFSLAPSLGTYEELLKFLETRKYRFFIFDKQTGVLLYPDMEFLRFPENRPAGLVPILVHRERDFVVYRVEGAGWLERQPVGARLENGIILTGYEMYQSNDSPPGSGRRVGLYLHWEATVPVSSFLKVFVHVFDEAGHLVTQNDGVPALWTHPTSDWTSGERIVDFHPILFDPALGRGPFTIRVGLYDAGTGKRISVLDSSSHQMNDRVVLETFVFD